MIGSRLNLQTHRCRLHVRASLVIFCVCCSKTLAAEIDIAPNRFEFPMPAMVGGVGADNAVLLFSGTRSVCAPKSHGEPKHATLYLFDPSNYSGKPPEITTGSRAGCFVITGALSKVCLAGDEKCFRASPRVTAALHYPTTLVERKLTISAPPQVPPEIPQLHSLADTFCSAQQLVQTRVCSLPGKRLAHVSAQLEPAPDNSEAYDLLPDYADSNGPCVAINVRGAGKQVGTVYIPTQLPVTSISPKIAVNTCAKYPGGELKIKATYSVVDPVD
jgi:hypothetical protein